MTTDVNKKVVQAHMDAWNKLDPNAFDELFAPGYVHHDPTQPEVRDLRGLKQFAQAIWTAYPDFNGRVDRVIAEGDLVAKQYTINGTHKGEFAGLPPSGNKVSFTGVTIYRLENGKIAESWWNYDVMSVMQQIGAIPAPA
jgi:steroid delta-isomerase-like uncharacterized protein